MPQSGLRSSTARTPRAGRTRSSGGSNKAVVSRAASCRRWRLLVGCCGCDVQVAHAVAGVCRDVPCTAGMLVLEGYLGLCWLAAAATSSRACDGRSARRLGDPPLPPQPQPEHGQRPALARSSAPRHRPFAGQREPGAGPDRARPRRAPLAAGLGGSVDRASLRFSFHGQGRQAVLRRDRADEQRPGAGDRGPYGRPDRQDAAASTGSPRRSAA